MLVSKLRYLAASAALMLLAFGTANADTLLILPATVVEGGCIVGGSGCAIVILVPDNLNRNDPFGTGNLPMGLTAPSSGSESPVGADLYQMTATQGNFPSPTVPVYNVYSKTGRDVTAQALALFLGSTYYSGQ